MFILWTDDINIFETHGSLLHKDSILCIIMLTVKALPAEVQGLYFQQFELLAVASLFVKTQNTSRLQTSQWRCSQKKRREKNHTISFLKARAVSRWQNQALKATVLSAVVRAWWRRGDSQTNIHSDCEECVKWSINHELNITGASDSHCGWTRSTLFLLDEPQNHLKHSLILDSSVVHSSQREGLKINTLKLILDRKIDR